MALRLASEKLVACKLVCKPVTAGIHTCLPVFVFLAHVLKILRARAGERAGVLGCKCLQLCAGCLCGSLKLLSVYLVRFCKSFRTLKRNLFGNHNCSPYGLTPEINESFGLEVSRKSFKVEVVSVNRALVNTLTLRKRVSYVVDKTVVLSAYIAGVVVNR